MIWFLLIDLGEEGGLSMRDSSGLVGLGRKLGLIVGRFAGSGGGGAFGLGSLRTGALGFSFGDGYTLTDAFGRCFFCCLIASSNCS